MSDELADNLRKYRRASGLSQEQLAHRSGLSVGPIRRIEQGADGVRMETLHQIARTLGVKTSDLMAAGTPEPVKHDDPNSLNLRELRIALTPAMGLLPPRAPTGEEPDLRRLRRMTHDHAVLYFGDSYKSIAADLPALIRAVSEAGAYYDSGQDRIDALVARSEALQLVGRYLTQIRQYDLAHSAIRESIADAREAEAPLTAASGVGGMCWMLMRTERYDEAEDIAVATMDLVEPKIKGASPDEYATWGGLAMEAAAAAARNNRPEEARTLRRAAGTAAKAVGVTHRNLLRHWSMFGPVTAAMKELEDSMIAGDARSVVRKSGEEESLQPKSWKRLGKPSSNDGNRYYLDLARAQVRTGDPTGAMEELARLDAVAPEWFRHQSSAAITFEEITKKRRTLTTEMREVGAHLGVFA
ncbi:helix-turn-helix domain-containing protein [Streptomyces sp. NBC_01237]|uniref:helix-turn-helix domain-containing protein n=1 Tax=Streptomyces sp. NBC_01237 TaxID=2903790 RepID=UPI002DD9676D|nr:helix-turn-helix domain-containing protein [Streptomyces sp. NBC_01237]WRZ72657.1 helix-turn-helix domain-containing protein [Streptomyces sp. NBC_01237]